MRARMRYVVRHENNMNSFLKFGALMSLVLGSLVWLAIGGIKETKTYYKTVLELRQMGTSAEGQRIRVGGDVQAGSITKNGTTVSFVLHQGANRLNVRYMGSDPLPDTFKENAQALADGRKMQSADPQLSFLHA